MNIDNEQDLINYFHSIHNFIRNKVGLYGKAALQFYNFFFVLKTIEKYIGTQINFDNDDDNNLCKYSNILQIKDIDDNLQEQKRIDRTLYIKKIIQKSQHRDTFFMDFSCEKFNVKNRTITEFINKLNILTPEIMDKYHVHGRVYEYFIGHVTGRNIGSRNGSQMEDLGQFFTSRELVRYCISKVNPQIINQKVPSMADFFCGSGGFITEYIRFINTKQNINWDENINKIYGADADVEIIKSARVDIMTLTNTFQSQNQANTFTYNFLNMNTFEEDFYDVDDYNKPVKVDFIFTNPPYGNSGSSTMEDKLRIDTAGSIIKQIAMNGSINNQTDQKQKKYLIKGDNKETLSLLHGMGYLSQNGIYCGVLKQGVFFDKKFTELRTQLCLNYEVLFVITVPKDFLNTNTQTSIMIFKNSGKSTTHIEFIELEGIMKNEQIIGFNEINLQTKEIINTFTTQDYQFTQHSSNKFMVSFKQLQENKFSFNIKQYLEQQIIVNKNFIKIKLGDIVQYKSKTNHPAQDGKEKGLYRYYTSSQKIKYVDYIDIQNELCIILGSGGAGCLYLDDNFSVSQHIMTIKSNNDYLTTFIYYYLKINWEQFYKQCYNGSTLRCTNKSILNDYEIQIPEQIELVKLYIDYLQPTNQTLQTLQTLQKQKEQSICAKIKLLTQIGIEGVDYDEYLLKDIVSIKDGYDFYKNEMDNDNIYKQGINYPILNVSDEQNNVKYVIINSKYEKYIAYKNDIIIGLAGTVGDIYYSPYQLAYHKHHVLRLFNPKISNQQLFLQLKTILDSQWIEQNSCITVIRHLRKETICEIKMRVLKEHILQKYGLQDEFIFMDKLKNDISQTFKQQEQITNEMMQLMLQ